ARGLVSLPKWHAAYSGAVRVPAGAGYFEFGGNRVHSREIRAHDHAVARRREVARVAREYAGEFDRTSGDGVDRLSACLRGVPRVAGAGDSGGLPSKSRRALFAALLQSRGRVRVCAGAGGRDFVNASLGETCGCRGSNINSRLTMWEGRNWAKSPAPWSACGRGLWRRRGGQWLRSKFAGGTSKMKQCWRR